MPSSLRAAITLAAALLAFVPAVARADDSTTVTVQGTTDVSDSHLIQAVIQPGFEAAYPQYKLNYVAPSGGTGAAFTAVEAGNGSAALVHAPAIENQFVRDGFSAEQYGRAVFYGDFVILGPSSDPAHVLTDAPHDAAKAFAQIAQAAANDTADFVSRGGASGTSVAEHAIWALAQSQTTGVTYCTVSDNNGGGVAPSNVTGTCPGAADNPSWYHTTGLGQGPNVTATDTCNFGHGIDCYMITDRGTFQYLQSTNAIAHLEVVARDNAAGAPGGSTLLINSFHAYAINPDAPFTGGAHPQLNLAGAKAFLDYLTSPTAQAAIGAYLNGGGDPPFLPDASPALTATAPPATVTAGTPLTITGTIKNVVPGTPTLFGASVNLNTSGGSVASGTADANGNYSISYTPTSNAAYTISTPQIGKIENSTLNPAFGDLLTPTTKAVGSTTVQSVITVSKVTPGYRTAIVTGTVTPAAAGTVTILARKQNSGAAFTSAGTGTVSAGAYSVKATLAPGKWVLQAHYDNPSVLSSVATLVTAGVTGSSSIRISHATVSKTGALRLTGSLSPAPDASGAYVRLMGRKSKKLGRSSTATYRAIGEKATIAKGRRSFTISTHLTRGYRWSLRVEYVHKGHVDTSNSKTRSIDVR
jgi:tungstate transport system substrate-binding protein